MLMTIHHSKDYGSGVYSLDRCLVKAYSQQTKEINGSTGEQDTAADTELCTFSHCYFCTALLLCNTSENYLFWF